MLDEETKHVSVVLSVGLASGILVGCMRGIIQARHDGWTGLVRGVLASILVGLTLSAGLDQTTLSQTTKIAIIAPCCFVADDLLVALTSLAQLFSRNPLGFLSRFRRAWAGVRDDTPEEPKQ